MAMALDRPLERPLTVIEAAAVLQIHPKTMAKWLREGKVRGVQIPGRSGHEWRVPRAALQKMVA